MKISNNLYWGFGIVIALLLAINLFTYNNLIKESQAVDLNLHTYEVISVSEQISSALTDIETGARGFALSGREDFLEPYTTGVANFKVQLDKLRLLSSDNPRQLERIDRLEQQAAEWVGVENRLIQLRRDVLSGRASINDVTALVAQGQGKSHMDRIRKINDEITAEENTLLIERRQLLKSMEEKSRYAGFAGGTIAIGLGVLFCFFINREMKERRTAEKVLEQAHATAIEASVAKSQFIANMSHEIRTPLNAIIGMSDLLWETPLTVEQEQYVRVSRTAGDNLLTIISDILDISKIEAGRLDLESIPFDPIELVDRTCEVLSLRAHEKGLELTHFVKADVPSKLLGDPGRLQQILTNLIGNAIKFTSQGEISLTVKKIDTTGQSVRLLFTVKDTGIGIPQNKLQHIFEQFTQVDASTTRKYGGTGLGLAISRQLVEKMGGTLSVESVAGAGSTFTFDIILPVAQEPVIPTKGIAVPCNKILVIDDNETNRLIVKCHLKRWGVTVDEAASGQEALAALQDAHYDLLIVDGMMPGMDGFGFIAEVRKQEKYNHTAIMMLTSDCRSQAVERCSALGITSYIIKPVKAADLKDAVTAALSGAAKATPAGGEAATTAAKTRRILLTDDSADNRLLIAAYLKNLPYEIDMADNGAVAVEKFKANNYDLIFMDIQMPVMDGYTATATMRALEAAGHRPRTPIIALTAFAMKEDSERAIAAGCDAHLSKPVRKETLLSLLESYLNEKSDSE